MSQKAVMSATSQPPPSAKSGSFKRKCCFLFCFLFILIAGFLSLLFFFGQRNVHSQTSHKLLASFDEFPAHKKLITALNSKKYSILSGNVDQGLLLFVEHYANLLTKKGRTVYFEIFDSEHYHVFELLKDAKVQLVTIIGAE